MRFQRWLPSLPGANKGNSGLCGTIFTVVKLRKIGGTMTKKDIVIEVAARKELSHLTQVDVKRVIQSTMDHIVDSLMKGETIELRNFGVFKVKTRKGRMARNPKTGEKVSVPDRKVAVFKPGLVMKKKIQQ